MVALFIKLIGYYLSFENTNFYFLVCLAHRLRIFHFRDLTRFAQILKIKKNASIPEAFKYIQIKLLLVK